MYHTLAWFESINNVTDEDIAPVSDDVIAIVNNHFFPGQDLDLLWSHVGSATMSRARWANAKFRQIVENQIRPPSLSLLPPTDPNVQDYTSHPLRMRANEEIILQASGAAGGAENFHALAGVQMTPYVPVPSGDIFTIRGTHATTVTANAWTNCTMTWDSGLPAGRYAIVGGYLQSVTAVGFRFNLENQTPRPGGLGFATLGLRSHRLFYPNGGLGVWGYFTSARMPLVQAFCNAADSAGVAFVDFIRVSEGLTF